MKKIMSRIAVIGCGVIGLSTAIEIQKEIQQSEITIFTEELSPNTTGDVSAGFWTPYLLQNTPIDDVMYVQILIFIYAFLKKIFFFAFLRGLFNLEVVTLDF